MTSMMRPIHAFALALFLGTTGVATILAACDGDSSAVKEQLTPGGDSGPITLTQDGAVITPMQDGGDSGPTDCVQNPQTHEEIINGCTTATRVTKNPTLPLLLPDGDLPPIM